MLQIQIALRAHYWANLVVFPWPIYFSLTLFMILVVYLQIFGKTLQVFFRLTSFSGVIWLVCFDVSWIIGISLKYQRCSIWILCLLVFWINVQVTECMIFFGVVFHLLTAHILYVYLCSETCPRLQSGEM